jgi:hypothetical protein
VNLPQLFEQKELSVQHGKQELCGVWHNRNESVSATDGKAVVMTL